MKKLILTLAVVLVAALAVTGFVSAQSSDPNNPTPGFGWMQGMHSQMMGTGFAGMGVMHDAMVQALADKLGISVADLNQQLADGKTMWQIAESKGWTVDQFQTWMVETHTATINQLVADGKLTQQQADWMNGHMSQMIENGYGPGTCHGTGPNSPGSSGSPTSWMGRMMGWVRGMTQAPVSGAGMMGGRR